MCVSLPVQVGPILMARIYGHSLGGADFLTFKHNKIIAATIRHTRVVTALPSEPGGPIFVAGLGVRARPILRGDTRDSCATASSLLHQSIMSSLMVG